MTTKLFLDSEFQDDGTTIDLISLAVVSSSGREFYAASTDARLDRVDDWVRENVLPKLPPRHSPLWMSRLEIRERLANFVASDLAMSNVETTRPEWWAYYGDYDWVVLSQLYGSMLKLPKIWPRYCNDLKQLSVSLGSPEFSKPEGAHSALEDARWNRSLHAFLDAKREERERQLERYTAALRYISGNASGQHAPMSQVIALGALAGTLDVRQLSASSADETFKP